MSKTPLLDAHVPKRIIKRWQEQSRQHLWEKLKAVAVSPWALIWHMDDDRTRVLPPYEWIQTIDYDMGGDKPWQKRWEGWNRYNYFIQLLWILRNGAQYLTYVVYGEVKEHLGETELVEGSVDKPELVGGEKLRLIHTKHGALTSFYYQQVVPLKWWPGRGLQRMWGHKITSDVEYNGWHYHKLIRSTRIIRLGKDQD